MPSEIDLILRSAQRARLEGRTIFVQQGHRPSAPYLNERVPANDTAGSMG